ncbi:hypothetical protein CLV30_106116 [Haloactinopolyspora alba]|uniref:Uncharacterized protein n=1 Tax=Haloactinopolyspora alba TaxID=648780 RepID=A0A2P8E3R3_9ACTN|nr:hypothetical protein [Haloactinopolyspora alba]PSL04113.1 hypothetical protein CLV30_106116 [Haloactinopolyspora alba]
MIELLTALLVAVLPACPASGEDSAWCTNTSTDRVVVNLEMADPAPARLVMDR